MTIDLPTPPTLNHMYTTVGRRRVLKATGREYMASVRRHCLVARVRPIAGSIVVSIVWRRKYRSGDLDNRGKIVLDALQGAAFHNDSQIVELHLYRRDDPANPGVTVTVEAAP